MSKSSATAPAPRRKPSRSADRSLRGSSVPAVMRAAAILRFLGESNEALGVQAIARVLNIIPSTCLHLLRTLVAENFVAFDPDTKRYSLDAGVLALARSWLRQNRFGEIVQPTLAQLSKDYGVTTIGVQIFGLEQMIVVGISQSAHILNPHADIGSRFPALASATGRCVAAFGRYTWDQLTERFEGLPWQNPPSFAAWRREVEAARANGYAIDQGNFLGGVTIVSAPVFDLAGNPRHAVVAVGIREQLARAKLEPLTRDLRLAAQKLSRQMGAT